MTAPLEVDSIRRRLGSREVLRDVSFRVAAGEVVGLLGRNGAGKSTLLRIVCGIEPADSGTVRIHGADGGGRPSRRVGAMLDPAWLDRRLTCSDHVGISLRLTGERAARRTVHSALDRVGLTGAARKRVGRISLGMRQRLALCVATIHSPTILVLDEPVNGLDPDGVLWLREMVRRFADQGGSVLLSSHLMSEMERAADRVVVLEGGSLRGVGSPGQWGTSAGVLVESSATIDALARAARSRGARVERTNVNQARICGLDPAEVFDIAVANGVVLTRLEPVTVSLEDFYRSMVADDPRPR